MDDYESRWFWDSCKPVAKITAIGVDMGNGRYRMYECDMSGVNIARSWIQEVEYTIYAPGYRPSNPPQDNNKPTTNG